MRLEIDAREIRRFEGRIDEMVARGQDLRPMYEEIAELGVASTQMNFRLGKAPDGTEWQKSIRVKQQGGQTLKLSGRLAASISPESTSTLAAWGTNVIYARPHQEGMTISAKNAERLAFNIPGIGFRTAEEVTIPARPFLGFNEQLLESIGDVVQDHYFRGMVQ